MKILMAEVEIVVVSTYLPNNYEKFGQLLLIEYKPFIVIPYCNRS